MTDEELMERVFEVIWDPHLEMAECRDLCRLIRRYPAKPFANAEDVSIYREARTL